jgi:uncharacterized protein
MATHSTYFFLDKTQKASLAFSDSADSLLWWTHFLTDGKFYSIFSMLFGMGFAIQLQKAEGNSSNFTSYYARRLVILFLFGLLHAVALYVGDILMFYALVGFTLFFFRKASARSLLVLSAVLLALPVLQYLLFYINASPETNANPDPEFFIFLRSTYQTGSFIEIAQINAMGTVMGRYPDLFFTGRAFKVLAMFLLGFYIVKKGLYKNLEQRKGFFIRLFAIGLFVGLPLNAALATLMEQDSYYAMTQGGYWLPIVYAYGVPLLALSYTSGITYLYTLPRWQPILQVFAPVGRMALTNYLMQSLICATIFMGWGFGMAGKVGPAIFLSMGVGIYVLQVLGSLHWLRTHRYGPMEMLWRRLTYGRVVVAGRKLKAES